MAPGIGLVGSPGVTKPDQQAQFRSIVRDMCLILGMDSASWHSEHTPSTPRDSAINAVNFLFYQARPTLESFIETTKAQSSHNGVEIRNQLASMVDQVKRSRSARSRSALTLKNLTTPMKTAAASIIVNKCDVQWPTVAFSMTDNRDLPRSAAASITNKKRDLPPPIAMPSTGFNATKKAELAIPPAKKRRTDEFMLDNSIAADAQLQRETQESQDRLVDHLIRDFPKRGFGFSLEDEERHLEKDIATAWELVRAMQAFPKKANELKAVHSIAGLIALIKPWLTDYVLPTPDDNISEYTLPVLSASLYYDDTRNTKLLASCNTSQLLTLTLNPRKKDKGCRLSRKYGWQNLLYVDVDLRNTMPVRLKSSYDQIKHAFQKWLLKPKTLFRREWRAFHIEPHKKPKSKLYQYRVVFFNVGEAKLRELVEFMLPFQANADQPACKAYSRFDLALSRTKAALQFEASQIRFVRDLYSGEPEITPYLDRGYQNMHRSQLVGSHEAMTDGCALISVGAARLVCENLGLIYKPALFQARIAGAKGVWHISADYATADPEHLKIWIEIRDSQLKVKHDLTECTTLSFDIVKHSMPPKTSELHRDFLQILESRGVERQVILDLAARGGQSETDLFLDALANPAVCARLVQRFIKDVVLEEDKLPPGCADRLYYFMRHGGFRPDDMRFMADEYIRLFCELKVRSLENFRIPCSATTQLIGIADPTRTLPPGSVHIRLSRAIIGSEDDAHVTLAGRPVLVARDPTLRQSDIQKMDVVDWPALSHLTDCIVFSSRGSIPGAQKLQGGDYDGDIFWVCWQPELTDSFKNAPVMAPKPYTELGIVKDDKTLRDFLGSNRKTPSNRFVDRFLEHVFRLRMQDDYLGMATNKHYALTHATGELESAQAMDLVDIHDYLVDAAKNGYTFEGYHDWIEQSGLSNLPEPYYKTVMKSLEESTCKNMFEKLSTVSTADGLKQQSHILHDLFFKVLAEAAKRDARLLTTKLQGVPLQDEEVLTPMQNLRDAKFTSLLESKINPQINALIDDWIKMFQKQQFSHVGLDKLIARYRKITPPADVPWLLYKPSAHAFSAWDLIKASLLANRSRRIRAVYNFARAELCQIKSSGTRGRETLSTINKALRVQRLKAKPIDGSAADVSFATSINSESDDDDYQADFDMDDLKVFNYL